MATLKHLEKENVPPAPASSPAEDGADDITHGWSTETSVASGSQALHRKLRGKEVQLFAIGGAIGTCTLNPFPNGAQMDTCPECC